MAIIYFKAPHNFHNSNTNLTAKLHYKLSQMSPKNKITATATANEVR